MGIYTAAEGRARGPGGLYERLAHFVARQQLLGTIVDLGQAFVQSIQGGGSRVSPVRKQSLEVCRRELSHALGREVARRSLFCTQGRPDQVIPPPVPGTIQAPHQTDRVLADGHDVFVEIHPHIVLARSVQENLGHAKREGAVLPSLKRGEEGHVMMLGSLGALYTLGYPVDWRKLYPSGGRTVRLPFYPFHRERYWLEIPEGGKGRSQRQKCPETEKIGIF